MSGFLLQDDQPPSKKAKARNGETVRLIKAVVEQFWANNILFPLEVKEVRLEEGAGPDDGEGQCLRMKGELQLRPPCLMYIFLYDTVTVQFWSPFLYVQ